MTQQVSSADREALLTGFVTAMDENGREYESCREASDGSGAAGVGARKCCVGGAARRPPILSRSLTRTGRIARKRPVAMLAWAQRTVGNGKFE
jgi:hypothetical protein